MPLKGTDIIQIQALAKQGAWNKRCPLIKKACIKEKCPKWMDVQWTWENVDTGKHEIVQLQGCNEVFMPILMSDIITTTYQNVSAVEGIGQNLFNQLKYNFALLSGMLSSKVKFEKMKAIFASNMERGLKAEEQKGIMTSRRDPTELLETSQQANNGDRS